MNNMYQIELRYHGILLHGLDMTMQLVNKRNPLRIPLKFFKKSLTNDLHCRELN